MVHSAASQKLPTWAADYVGIPWRDKGRDHDGCDCYGLLVLIMRERFGVTLPSFSEDYATASEREDIAILLAGGIPDTGWEPVEGVPREGDGVVFRLQGQPWHVGVMLNAESFLHIDQAFGESCIDRINAPRWSRRIHGIFRLAVVMP